MLGIVHTVGGDKGRRIWKETFHTSQLLLKASKEHFLVYLQRDSMFFQLLHTTNKDFHTHTPLYPR